jgi:uncharacterized membrane protein
MLRGCGGPPHAFSLLFFFLFYFSSTINDVKYEKKKQQQQQQTNLALFEMHYFVKHKNFIWLSGN